jgi:hypothetical protein
VDANRIDIHQIMLLINSFAKINPPHSYSKLDVTTDTSLPLRKTGSLEHNITVIAHHVMWSLIPRMGIDGSGLVAVESSSMFKL